MKVMIGQFNTESNANIPLRCEITNYDLAFGKQCIEKMQVGDVFDAEGIEVIPAVYAVAGAAGVIKKDTFLYIASCFLRTAQEHLGQIDGMYLMLHGVSEVEELGSGDFYILQELRRIVGPYLPICICCDPHGNLSAEYVRQTTMIRSFRESPHTDMQQTYEKVAGILCRLLKKRQHIHPAYRKLPLILGGEQSVSTDEPVRSINRYMDELEQDPRILSCSWHVGYIRHDCPEAGCGVVVVPATEADQAYAEETADRLARFVWERRRSFHYTGQTAQPEEALRLALEAPKPAVLTDSGDNTTSGATGWNTYVLRQVLALQDTTHSILFASICDPAACRRLQTIEIGQSVSFSLGTGWDEMSLPVELTAQILHKGPVVKTLTLDSGVFEPVGQCVTVRLQDRPITIIIADHRQSYAHMRQFELAGVDCLQFDLTVVKQGYLFPELKQRAAFSIMSLTNGATPQDTSAIPFKLIRRPMYPIDDL